MKTSRIKINNLLVIALLIITVNTACQSDKNQFLLPDPGVVSYTFRHQFERDIPATLDIIKEMGLDNIEFSNLFGITASEMKELLDERGLACTSYGVGYNRILNDIENVAGEAITLGAKYVRVASIPYGGPEFTIEDARTAVKDFNSAGEFLAGEGIYFCYHNHGFEFYPYEEETLFDYMVRNTDPRFVSFELDLLWTVHPGQDPVHLLNKYPDRFRLMHLKDLRKGITGNFSGRTPVENDVVLGTGQIDFPAVLRAAENTNIEYYYIEDESPDVVERVPRSIEFITGLKR